MYSNFLSREPWYCFTFSNNIQKLYYTKPQNCNISFYTVIRTQIIWFYRHKKSTTFFFFTHAYFHHRELILNIDRNLTRRKYYCYFCLILRFIVPSFYFYKKYNSICKIIILYTQYNYNCQYISPFIHWNRIEQLNDYINDKHLTHVHLFPN